jgi:hypothetical protein
MKATRVSLRHVEASVTSGHQNENGSVAYTICIVRSRGTTPVLSATTLIVLYFPQSLSVGGCTI